ncbi:hypothetical protein [Xanthobacter wiegelii]|uniref:hypothetical protein n=1 Tax=Xanthobacter wiegelii TaxID=3119913 RepID=UPI00372670E1
MASALRGNVVQFDQYRPERRRSHQLTELTSLRQLIQLEAASCGFKSVEWEEVEVIREEDGEVSLSIPMGSTCLAIVPSPKNLEAYDLIRFGETTSVILQSASIMTVMGRLRTCLQAWG